MNDAIGRQITTPIETPLMTAISGQRTRVQWFPNNFKIPFTLVLATGALVALIVSSNALAAGSRSAVEAKPGEIVMLRAVPARPAVRSAPPAKALLIDASPKKELDQGLLEISPSGYGQVAAGTNSSGGVAPSGLGATITSITQQVGGSANSGNSAPSAAGGSMGSVTGSIGSTVTGALSGAGLMGQGGQR